VERKLCSVQRITKIESIEGADLIEKATVLGWNCVVMKGEFKEGDFAVYMEIDSFLPNEEKYSFLLKGSSLKKMIVDNKEVTGIRLKTKKMRGVLSQGLLLPLNIIPFGEVNLVEGQDVTEILGVVKWDPPIPAQLSGIVLGNFPGFLIKSDETRIQSCPQVLEELKGKHYYISTKMDGTSVTFYLRDDHFGVCSRNLELKETEGNTLWLLARKYKIEEILHRKFVETGKYFGIQAEALGPGIQKNPLMLKECEIRIFSIYNISDGKYLDINEMMLWTNSKITEGEIYESLPLVPIEEMKNSFDYTLDQLLERAKGLYPSEKQKEGIVIRPQVETYSETLGGRLSVKVINNNYLLKEEE